MKWFEGHKHTKIFPNFHLKTLTTKYLLTQFTPPQMLRKIKMALKNKKHTKIQYAFVAQR